MQLFNEYTPVIDSNYEMGLTVKEFTIKLLDDDGLTFEKGKLVRFRPARIREPLEKLREDSYRTMGKYFAEPIQSRDDEILKIRAILISLEPLRVALPGSKEVTEEIRSELQEAIDHVTIALKFVETPGAEAREYPAYCS